MMYSLRSLIPLLVLPLFIVACGSSTQPEKEPPTNEEPAESENAYVPKIGAYGTIQHFDMLGSQHIRPRNVDVWLPPGYDASQKYPVLYMHDGQNLFNPEASYAGISWEVDVILNELIQKGEIPPCIVVGIWNTQDRTIEYTPNKPFELLAQESKTMLANQERISASPKSDAYLKFVVEELKPLIDSSYSTLPERENTAICGSSMGGLISLYAMAEYPEVFGKAACLSTHWPLALVQDDAGFTQAYITYLQDKESSFNHTRLYFDYGTETLDKWYPKHQKNIDSVFREMPLEAHQYQSTQYTGAKHNELAWQKRFDQVAKFLFAENL